MVSDGHYSPLAKQVTHMHKLEYIEINRGKQPDALVIWLHGLGADGYDFKSLIEQLPLPDTLAIKFVLPHAPVLPVTLNKRAPMNAWYDIYSLQENSPEDEAGINLAMQSVENLISTQFSHYRSHRIILAGFSQGGAVALHCYLHGSVEIAGVLALSTYLPLKDKLAGLQATRLASKDIFMAHGEMDEILPLSYATRSRDALVSQGVHVDWHQYPMAHNLSNQEIEDLAAWLIDKLS